MNPFSNTSKPLDMGSPTSVNFNLSGTQTSQANQNNQTNQASLGAFGTSGIPWAPSTSTPTIPASTVAQPEQKLPLPEKPVSTTASTVTATAGGTLTPPPTAPVPAGAPQPKPTQQQAPVTGDYRQLFESELDKITTRPGELTEQFGIQKKLEDYNAAKTKYDLLKEGYRVEKEKVMMNGALSADQKQARIGEIERKEAFQAGTLAIEYAAKQQDYAGAKELMNQQLQLELEPIRMRADFYRDMFKMTEDQRFQRQMKAEERAYQEQKSVMEDMNSYKLDLLREGKITEQEFANIKNWDDLSKYTGVSSFDMQNKNNPTEVLSNFFKNPKIKSNEKIQQAGAVVSALQGLAESNPEGRFVGTGGFLFRTRTKGEEPIQNRGNISAIDLQIQTWASGANLSKSQEKLVKSLTPKIGDSDRVLRNKINGLTSFMLTDIKGRAATQGVSFNPEKPDFFASRKQYDRSGNPIENTATKALGTKVAEAVASGYDANQILKTISLSDPDMALKIETALQSYTPEEVIEVITANY